MALAYIALAASDAVRLVLLGDETPRRLAALPPARERAPRLAELLGGAVARGGASASAQRSRRYARTAPAPGAAIVISDFMTEPARSSAACRRCARRGFEVRLLHVLGARELDPEREFARGILEDVESGATHPIVLTDAVLDALPAISSRRISARSPRSPSARAAPMRAARPRRRSRRSSPPSCRGSASCAADEDVRGRRRPRGARHVSGIGFANPAGLFTLAAVAVLIALHLYDRRRRVVPVATMFLWKRIAAEPLQRQRFRPDALFLLQLLIVAALIAGYLRPFVETSAPGSSGAPLIVVVDTSASMQARERGGTRFDLARAPHRGPRRGAATRRRGDAGHRGRAAARRRSLDGESRAPHRSPRRAPSDRYADESRAGDRARARRGAGASARPGRGADGSAAGGERRDAARARARRLRAGRRDRRQRRHPEPDRGPAAVPRADRRHRDRARPQLPAHRRQRGRARRGSTAIRGSGARSTSRRAPPSRCCSRIRRTAARSP